MHGSFSHRWASFVVRHWGWIIIAWICAAVVAKSLAPPWDKIAYDGDFDYLPSRMTSVQGGRLLDEAFPGVRSRSQIVLVLGREKGALLKTDDVVGMDLLRRVYHRLGEVSWQRGIAEGYSGGSPADHPPGASWIQLAREAFDKSIEIDERFYSRIADRLPDDPPTPTEPRMAISYWDRGHLLEQWSMPSKVRESDSFGGMTEIAKAGEIAEAAATAEAIDTAALIEADYEAALILMPELPSTVQPIAQRDLHSWSNLIDVLSWEDNVVGTRLQKEGARLAVLQLSSELAATSNIATVEAVMEMLDDVSEYSMHYTEPDLKLRMTGSAAIGGETLIGARDAIRYTEWFTVAMILIILTLVYRAPLLVAIPMLSIGFAVVVSMNLVALMTQWSFLHSVPGLGMRVFTTSRIFVVVILFGAGTDYCLFLISRLREEARLAVWPVACRNALSGVSGALIGSAMTTVVGLGMLWIAQFGKFHYTGPVIAVCLLIGLLVCTTLTPALLRAFGPNVFWPTKIDLHSSAPRMLLGPTQNSRFKTPHSGVWAVIALILTRYPGRALLIGGFALCLPAVYGVRNEGSVTYDLSSQLNHSAQSRQGLRLLAQHFNVGEINPVTVLMVRKNSVERDELKKDIKQLSEQLYTLPGVDSVRTADDPLGDFPPGRGDRSLLRSSAWRRLALQNHRIAQGYFFSEVPELRNRLARFDIVIDGDPFSVDAAEITAQIEEFLKQQSETAGAAWEDSKVYLAGTTPSIIDLRAVTMSDNRRIKIAVVAAVFAVLVLVLRRFVLSFYLVLTVLVSFYATLGLTILFFRWAYGTDYVGLDWKLPLFLFVILVAVGQDYNVYLVTRIHEEQRKLGALAALRRAVTRTGGIITACGLVMAATFFSMTASAWFPAFALIFGYESQHDIALRGITELGFALGLGVLIDTFYVRTILVPAYVALSDKWFGKGT